MQSVFIWKCVHPCFFVFAVWLYLLLMFWAVIFCVSKFGDTSCSRCFNFDEFYPLLTDTLTLQSKNKLPIFKLPQACFKSRLCANKGFALSLVLKVRGLGTRRPSFSSPFPYSSKCSQFN